MHILKPYFTFIYSHVSPLFFRYPVKCVLTFSELSELDEFIEIDVPHMLPNTTEKRISERHFLEAIWRHCSGLLRVFILSMKAEGALTFDAGEEQKPHPPGRGVKDGLNETRLMPYLRLKPEK